MKPRKGKVIVYRRAWLWYGECPECPAPSGDDNRIRSPFLPTTHRLATEHAAAHTAVTL